MMVIFDFLSKIFTPRTSDCKNHQHQAELDTLLPLISLKPNSLKNLDTADVYQWSLYHLLTNEQVIQEKLFPIKLFNASGQEWTFVEEMMPDYSDMGVNNYKENINECTLSVIENHPPQGEPKSYQLLADMAVVIRSKDAGVNRLTYDIIFNSLENYQTALRSNVFSKENVAPMVHVPIKHVVGTYHVDTCNAIKISIDRPIVSASLDETDVFGCQQEAEFILMRVPIY